MHVSPSQTSSTVSQPAAWPIGRALTGLALVLVAWALSWFGPERIGAHAFTPLWLGYILIVDSVVEARTGTSLRTRNLVAFMTLFLLSIPLWWLFEAANARLQNWHYHVPASYGLPTPRIEQSLAFSTVLPAVFETSELVWSTRIRRIGARWRGFSLSLNRLRAISIAGVVMTAAVLLLPRYLFPLVWIGAFLVIDPINAQGGRRSLLVSASKGRWTPMLVLAAASLICGFFWEMWNIRAAAKWTYEIPYFDWLRLFEMPILGYGGYIPFAFELYAAYHLITAVLPARSIARLTIDQRGNDSRERARS